MREEESEPRNLTEMSSLHNQIHEGLTSGRYRFIPVDLEIEGKLSRGV